MRIKRILIGMIVIVFMLAFLPIIFDKYIIGNSIESNISNEGWITIFSSYGGGIVGSVGALVGVYLGISWGDKKKIQNAENYLKFIINKIDSEKLKQIKENVINMDFRKYEKLVKIESFNQIYFLEKLEYILAIPSEVGEKYIELNDLIEETNKHLKVILKTSTQEYLKNLEERIKSCISKNKSIQDFELIFVSIIMNLINRGKTQIENKNFREEYLEMIREHLEIYQKFNNIKIYDEQMKILNYLKENFTLDQFYREYILFLNLKKYILYKVDFFEEIKTEIDDLTFLYHRIDENVIKIDKLVKDLKVEGR